jgi:hypothetical protein
MESFLLGYLVSLRKESTALCGVGVLGETKQLVKAIFELGHYLHSLHRVGRTYNTVSAACSTSSRA